MLLSWHSCAMVVHAGLRLPPLSMEHANHHTTCCITPAELRERCLDAGPALELDVRSRLRVEGYVDELLRYNEHTNVYSKTAYAHLPFHVHDSITLGLVIAEASGSGVLDLGSGSGLPSLLIACVNPEV